jgi:Dolichyl-phosphate-mannose-protein mannosyltransferase
MIMRIPYDGRASDPKQKQLLWALVVAALVPRAWLAMRAGIIEHDGAHYAGLAAAICRGDWAHAWSTIWPPLYPALVATTAILGGVRGSASPETFESVARLVSVIAGALSLIPLASISRRALGNSAAWIPVALAASHPRLIQYSASALTEATFTLFLLIAIERVMAAEREPGPATDAVAGVAFGLAYLARPEGVLIAGAVWLTRVLVAPLRRGRQRSGVPLRLQPWLLVGLLLTMLPYLMWTRGQLGHFSLGEKGGYNLWRVHRVAYDARFGEPAGLSERVFESPELASTSPPGQVEMGKFVAAEPLTVVQTTLGQLARIVFSSIPAAIYLPWLLPALVGLPLLFRRELWPLAVVLISVPLLYAPFSVDRRFFVPLIPFLLVPATGGLLTIGEWNGGRRATLLAVGLLCAYGLAYASFRPLMDSAPEHRAAGEWLRAEWPSLESGVPEDSVAAAPVRRPVVMSRKTWVAHYAGGLIAELPDGGLDSLRARIARKQADVLVVDERWAVASRPWLAPLLDPAKAPSGARLLWRTDSTQALVLYDVRDWR